MTRITRACTVVAMAAILLFSGSLGTPVAQASSESTSPITIVATTSAAAPTSATSVTIAKPSGVRAGDVLVARVANRNNVSTTMTASGWREVGVRNSIGMLKSWIFWKVASGSEPDSYTFTLSDRFPMAGSITAFRNVDPLSPFSPGGYTAKVNGNSTTFAAENDAVTTPAGNSLAIWWGTQLFSGSRCPSPGINRPSGFIGRQQSCLADEQGLLLATATQQLGAQARHPIGKGSSAYANTNIVQTLTLRPATVPVKHRATSAAVAANAKTLSIAKPAGTVPGDVLVARVSNRNATNNTINAPAGWRQVNRAASTYSIHSVLFVKVAGPVEPASYLFNFNLERPLAGTISAFSGVDTARPVDGSIGQANSGSSRLDPGTGLKTTAAGGAAVWFATQAVDQTSCTKPLTQPASYVELAEQCLTGNPGIAFSVATANQRAAGNVAPAVGTSSVSATNTTQMLVLRRAQPAQTADAFSSTVVQVGNLTDGADGTNISQDVLYQPSGIAYSRINPQTLYAHSEKDRQTMVAFSATDGKLVGKFRVPVPDVHDTEDMDVGPCPAGSCVFIADIGSGLGSSKPNNIYSVVRYPEPDLTKQTSGTLTGDVFRYKYPDGRNKESEALVVNPRSGAMYIITKWMDYTDPDQRRVSEVYAFPPSPAPGSTSILKKIASITLPAQTSQFSGVTAASAHPTSNRVLIRNYRYVFEFRAPAGQPFEAAFQAQPVQLTDTSEPQGESITYDADGSAYYTLSERNEPPYMLKRVDRI